MACTTPSSLRVTTTMPLKHIALITLLWLLAGCAQETPAATPAPPTATPLPLPTGAPQTVSLNFWTVLPDRGVSEKALDEIVRGFQRDNPNIVIRVSSQPSGTELYRRVVASIAAGTLPDLVTGADYELADYARLDALVPLDEYIADPVAGLSQGEIADIPSAVLPTTRLPDGGSRIYSLPFARGVTTLAYNWGAMKAIGITNTPRTWDEFRLHARTLTKGGVRGFAYRLEAQVFEALLDSRGAALYNADQTKVAFNAPAAGDALAYLAEGVREGWIYRATPPNEIADFAGGRVIFTVASTAALPVFQDAIAKGGKVSDWGFAAFPQAEGRKAAALLDGSNIALLQSSAERQRAAWLFLRYWMRSQTAAAWTQATGALPNRLAARAALADYLARTPQQKQAIEELLPAAHAQSPTRYSAEIRVLIEEAWALADANKSAPAAALDAAAAKANVLLAEKR